MTKIEADGTHRLSEETPTELNSRITQYDEDGNLQIHFDKEAARQHNLKEINENFIFSYTTDEFIRYRIDNGYYDAEIFEPYDAEFINEIFQEARNFKFRFPTFAASLKFNNQYALKSRDGTKYLEKFEDRCVMVALGLAQGDKNLAKNYLQEIITGRFQPATPTFLNMGKKQRGEYISCFLVDMQDDMNSISRAHDAALQLSKRGGGVGLNLNNLREAGAPIKGIENAGSGIVPVMKMLEDAFNYANQLGQRQGAGAVYLNAHHPDIHSFLDSKRENADAAIRIQTLSLGVVIPDITMELAQKGEDMYCFSPYDVERVYGKPFSEIYISEVYYDMVDNPEIKKYKTSARKLLQKIADVQMESGYPYIMFEDNVNKVHNIDGKVKFSNICSEILQVHEASTINEKNGAYTHVGRDVSCNLGSLDIAKVLDGGDIENTVAMAMRALTSVSDQSDLQIIPTIKKGNDRSHAVGLGLMNLHGALARDTMMYGDEDSLEFASSFTAAIRYYTLKESHKIAVEKNETFFDFDKSKYASGEAFDKYVEHSWLPKRDKVQNVFAKYGIALPTIEDWKKLKTDVMRDGIYHAYQQAIAPTGSISYIRNATASIQPIIDIVEIRKEGMMGRVAVPMPFLEEGALPYYETAYDVGYKKLIDVYAAVGQHVDQGMSLTLYFTDTATTRDLNMAQGYAWRKGIKTLYYTRLKRQAMSGVEQFECVSCSV